MNGQITGIKNETFFVEIANENGIRTYDISLQDDGAYNDTVKRVTIEKGLTGVVLSLIALCAVVGNVLVIVAVVTTKRLRTITNYFTCSLAVSDVLVAILVLPPSIAYEVMGYWPLGFIFCDVWVTCDVMLCTASILNLCCISVDRFLAVTSPLKYYTRRSKKLASLMIGLVWVLSVFITCPPLFGWKEQHRYSDNTDCTLITAKGYVIYSACGSFFVPAIFMLFFYVRIFMVTYEHEKKHLDYRRYVSRNIGRRSVDDSLERSDSHSTSSPKCEDEQASAYNSRCTRAQIITPDKTGYTASPQRILAKALKTTSPMREMGRKSPLVRAQRQIAFKRSVSDPGLGPFKNDKHYMSDEQHSKMTNLNNNTILINQNTPGFKLSSSQILITTAENNTTELDLKQYSSKSPVSNSRTLRQKYVEAEAAGLSEMPKSLEYAITGKVKRSNANDIQSFEKSQCKVLSEEFTGSSSSDASQCNSKSRQEIQPDVLLSTFLQPRNSTLSLRSFKNYFQENNSKILTRSLKSMKNRRKSKVYTNFRYFMRERKTARTLGIVVGCFVICWCPFFLMYIIVPFCPSCKIGEVWVKLLTWLGYTNSLLNPFIYAFDNIHFRDAFRRLTIDKLKQK